jgi:hypothetical protein
MPGRITAGVLAGAVGTLALDAATYGDMAVRGRPASDLPAQTLHAMLEQNNIAASGEGPDTERAHNRESGLAALGGYAVGVSVGVAYAIGSPLLRHLPAMMRVFAVGGAAMVAGNVGPVLAGTTNPADWGASGWIADAVPHLVYGLVTVTVFDAISGRRAR